MTDAILVRKKGEQLLDDSGDPLAAGTVEWFLAGTSTPVTVYSDKELTTELGVSDTLDSTGRFEDNVFTGSAAYKEVVKDSTGATVSTADNLLGAYDHSSLSSGSGGYADTVQTSSDLTLTASHKNNLVVVTTTGGDVTITLDAAGDWTDEDFVTIKKSGAANAVIVKPESGDQVDGGDVLILLEDDEAVTLLSDESDWYKTATSEPDTTTREIIQVESITTSTPPASPDAGAIYIMPSGVLGGAWVSASQNQFAAFDGIGTYAFRTPTEPTFVWVKDESRVYQYTTSSGWEAWANVLTPAASDVPFLRVRYTTADGVTAASTTADTWETYPLASVENNITGASISASGGLVLPQATDGTAASYIIQGWVSADNTGNTITRLYNHTTSTEILRGGHGTPPYHNTLTGPFEVTAATEEIRVQLFGDQGGELGRLNSLTGKAEVFAEFTVWAIAREQGPAGGKGIQGEIGPGYTATSTTSLAIGTGTKVFTTQSGLAYTAGAYVRIASDADTDNYMAGVIASYSGTTLTVTVDATGGSGTHADWNINVGGPAGADGTASGFPVDFDGLGQVIAPGSSTAVEFPFNATITAVSMLADQTGSMVVDIQKDSYANYPPDSGDSICASAKPTISSANKSQDSTLTGWTTSVTGGEILRFVVDSCSDIERCTLTLSIQKS